MRGGAAIQNGKNTKAQKHKYTNTQIQRQIRMMVVLETSVYLSIRNILHNCAKYIQIQIQIQKYKYKYKYKYKLKYKYTNIQIQIQKFVPIYFHDSTLREYKYTCKYKYKNLLMLIRNEEILIRMMVVIFETSVCLSRCWRAPVHGNCATNAAP